MIIPYTVTVDRRAEWLAAREEWHRDELRSQYLRQSADTVSGRRAELDIQEKAEAKK